MSDELYRLLVERGYPQHEAHAIASMSPRSSSGARVKQDAARYQFLRGLHDPGPNDPRVHTLDQQTDPVQVRLCFGDDLDAAVDAAMRQP